MAARTISAPNVRFFHRLYGLIVESNIPIAGALEARGEAEVVVQFAEDWRPRLSGQARQLSSTHLFTLSGVDDGFVFDFPDGVQYVISAGGARIDVSWPSQFTAAYAATYLMNLVMAFVMRLRGHEVLHASAALIDGRAVAFIGPSGAGKSTIAACMALRGFPVISEDVVAITDRGTAFDITSAHTIVRLCPDVAALLFDDADQLPLIANAGWKRAFEVRDLFAAGRFELAAIYSIDDRRPGQQAPRVEPLQGSEALLDLIAATYRAGDTNTSPEEFERLGRIVKHVPMRLLVPGADLRTAPAMVDTIITDESGRSRDDAGRRDVQSRRR